MEQKIMLKYICIMSVPKDIWEYVFPMIIKVKLSIDP